MILVSPHCSYRLIGRIAPDVCEVSIPGLHGLCVDKIRNNSLLRGCLICYIII